MRFGKTAAEAELDTRGTGAGGSFIRYLRNGDNTFRILQEPHEWVYFWEHFNPGGRSFPCTNEPNCPGCNSDVEKMKRPGRRAAFNTLRSWEGKEYVDVYGIPSTLAEKLKNRAARVGSITDRDYTITKFKTAGDKVDYDIEADPPQPLAQQPELKDIEPLLAQSYNEAWGTPETAAVTRAAAAQAERESDVAAKVAAHKMAVQSQLQTDVPPSEPESENVPMDSGEDTVVTEAELREMPLIRLLKFCDSNGLDVPEGLDSVDGIVDWMLATQAS